MKPAIAANGLSQRFGPRQALRSLNLELEAGERLAVLGDNGAGKTTLLRLLATISRPAAGSLQLFGLDAIRQRSALRPRIGYLAHQPGLYPALTALENLQFFAVLHGLPRSRAAEALDELDLGGAAQRPAGQLSRGMQQRLAIARCLLHDPELVVLDEPDASLDSAGRSVLGRLLRGRTVVMASHDLGFAREICDRSLRLRDGRPLGDEFALTVLSRDSSPC